MSVRREHACILNICVKESRSNRLQRRSVNRCLGQAWMRRSLSSCWHSLLPWPSIPPCRCTKNCTSKHKKRNGYVTSRWNVPGTRQNWHNVVFYESTRRIDSWPMSWKPIGMPAYANSPRFRRKRNGKVKWNNASFPRSNGRRLPT